MKLCIYLVNHKYTITDCLGHEILINGERVQFSEYEQAREFIEKAEKEHDYMGMSWFDINKVGENKIYTQKFLGDIKGISVYLCENCKQRILGEGCFCRNCGVKLKK